MLYFDYILAAKTLQILKEFYLPFFGPGRGSLTTPASEQPVQTADRTDRHVLFSYGMVGAPGPKNLNGLSIFGQKKQSPLFRGLCRKKNSVVLLMMIDGGDQRNIFKIPLDSILPCKLSLKWKMK